MSDIGPAIGMASRAVVSALLVRVSARGFDGMTPAFSSLIPLLDEVGARPSALAQRTGVSKQAMSQLIRELARRGYVEQARDTSDTRAKLVRLTTRGVALRRACIEARNELHAIAARTLGAERLHALQDDLASLSAALNPPDKAGP